MIRTESLTKQYGRRFAVKDFDVEIGAHGVVGFLGLNGAGKTTTLRMLAGLLAPSWGKVWVDGLDLAGPGGARARARIGFLPDRPPLHDEMSVQSYLTYAARLRGASGGPSRVAEVLERTGLVEHADEPIGSLSHGYRQRVGIAQAIVHDPALVILDEPTSGLDPRQIVDMRALVRSLGDDHTVLLSSHNLHEVSETCDQLLLIERGRLVAQGTPGELSGERGRTWAFTLRGERAAVETAVAAGVERGLFAAAEPRPAGSELFELELSIAAEPEPVAALFVGLGLGLRRMQPASDPLESLFSRLTEVAQA